MTSVIILIRLGLLLSAMASVSLLTACVEQRRPSATSPDWIVESYFVKSQFPERANYLSGEMTSMREEPSFGSSVPADYKVTYHKLKEDNSQAIYAINAVGNSESLDLYCYLHNEGEWAIVAVRSLALPQFLYLLMDSLETASNLDDSTLAELARLKLLTASDRELFEYLKANLETFDRAVDDFLGNRESELAAALASLNLSGIYLDDEYPGCLFVSIGGIIDNEAGYLYVEKAEHVPEMTADHFIYIEEILTGWYLYKTT